MDHEEIVQCARDLMVDTLNHLAELSPGELHRMRSIGATDTDIITTTAIDWMQRGAQALLKKSHTPV